MGTGRHSRLFSARGVGAAARRERSRGIWHDRQALPRRVRVGSCTAALVAWRSCCLLVGEFGEQPFQSLCPQDIRRAAGLSQGTFFSISQSVDSWR